MPSICFFFARNLSSVSLHANYPPKNPDWFACDMCLCCCLCVPLFSSAPASIIPSSPRVVNASLGGRRTVGEGESQARIDEENPGEIIKEKEGKEGPLKGSNENLNLQLAGPDPAENGNGVTAPIKEVQQQTNGGSTPDGKDTAV